MASAYTQFSRDGSKNATLIPQKWSKKDYEMSFAANPLKPFMGTGDNAIIQVASDFLKDKGDKLTFALRALDNSDGQGDDGTYEGNEQKMTFYDMSVQLHERGNSWLLAGNMTEQSAYDDLRKKARTTATEWVGRIQSADLVSSLSGLATMALPGRVTGAVASGISTVDQTAISNKKDGLRHFCGGQTTDGTLDRVDDDASIGSTAGKHLFGTKVIEQVKRMARTDIDSSGSPISPLRPVYVNGTPYYILFISSLQEKALRAESAWLSAVQSAEVRGKQNPIFYAVDYVWNNVLVKVTDLIHSRTGAGGSTAPEYFESGDDVASGVTVHRALFCGAQAGVLGWGKMPVWTDGYQDWQKTKFGTHTNMIYGVKKTSFNNQEFGCITIDTEVNPDD